MLLVGVSERAQQAVEGLWRFVVEHTEQVLSSLGEGWLRVDALLLLLTQVSVLKERARQTTHSTHRLQHPTHHSSVVRQLRLGWMSTRCDKVLKESLNLRVSI